VYASDILYVVALYSSKVSILCLEMRLSVERIHVLLAKGSLLVTAAAMVASIVMVLLGATPGGLGRKSSQSALAS